MIGLDHTKLFFFPIASWYNCAICVREYWSFEKLHYCVHELGYRVHCVIVEVIFYTKLPRRKVTTMSAVWCLGLVLVLTVDVLVLLLVLTWGLQLSCYYRVNVKNTHHISASRQIADRYLFLFKYCKVIILLLFQCHPHCTLNMHHPVIIKMTTTTSK